MGRCGSNALPAFAKGYGAASQIKPKKLMGVLSVVPNGTWEFLGAFTHGFTVGYYRSLLRSYSAILPDGHHQPNQGKSG
jgi:hypothetical protein